MALLEEGFSGVLEMHQIAVGADWTEVGGLF